MHVSFMLPANAFGVVLLLGVFLSAGRADAACACDCPSGCKVFNASRGALSDGSGPGCVKNNIGITGQYGSCSKEEAFRLSCFSFVERLNPETFLLAGNDWKRCWFAITFPSSASLTLRFPDFASEA